MTQRSKLHESNWQIAIWLFGRPTRAISSALFNSLCRKNAARRGSLQAPIKAEQKNVGQKNRDGGREVFIFLSYIFLFGLLPAFAASVRLETPRLTA
jgi:hypothetical protein